MTSKTRVQTKQDEVQQIVCKMALISLLRRKKNCFSLLLCSCKIPYWSSVKVTQSGADQILLSLGILQARILEWVAMPPGNLPNPGIEPRCDDKGFFPSCSGTSEGLRNDSMFIRWIYFICLMMTSHSEYL